MKKVLYLILLFPLFVSAQRKIKTLEVTDTIAFAAVDRPGDLYVVSTTGQIQKFDKDGKLKVFYKGDQVPTVFDPRDGARIFAYYRDKQEYLYFNPSFDITAAYRIDSAFVIEPWLIAPSGDHNLWLLDNADNSLKKINLTLPEVQVEVTIDTTLHKKVSSFTHIRDYQGFVFLLDPSKGIDVFNNLGKHIKTIPTVGVHQFHFLGEELYYLQDHKLKFFDL
ncbi:MAG: hypothetical protein ACOYXT_16110, partial [Bacteroidota bacterium]